MSFLPYVYQQFGAQPQLRDNGACRVEGIVHKLKHVNIRENWVTACGLMFEQHHGTTPDQRATEDAVDCVICLAREGVDRW